MTATMEECKTTSLYYREGSSDKEYHVRLTVAVQRGNDGREFNDIKRIEILRIVDSPAAGFELPDEGDEGQP